MPCGSTIRCNSRIYHDVANSPIITNDDGYGLLNARLSYASARSSHHARAVRHEPDNHALSGVSRNVSRASGLAEASYGRPREWGASVSFKFLSRALPAWTGPAARGLSLRRIQPTKPPRGAGSSWIWSVPATLASCGSTHPSRQAMSKNRLEDHVPLPRKSSRTSSLVASPPFITAGNHWSPPAARFDNDLARFAALEDQGFHPRSGGRAISRVARRIVDEIARVAAEAQEGEVKLIAWATSCGHEMPCNSFASNTVGI